MSITRGLHRSLQQGRADDVAVICQGRSRTHAQLVDRVARLAKGLRDEGLKPGDRLAVVSANSDHMLEILLAASWAGLVFAPLNSRWSSHEVAFALNDVGARALATDVNFSSLAEELSDRCPELEIRLHLGDTPAPSGSVSVEALVESSKPSTDVNMLDGDLAGVFYTGGTTAHPKGVMLSHGNLVTAALGALADDEFIIPGGTVAHAAPLFHLAGIWPWVAGLLTGSTHVVIPVFEPQLVIDELAVHNVSDVLLVPTMIQQVVGTLARTGQPLPALRHLVYAGSPMPEATLAATEKVLPNVGLIQAYGMTELAPVATMLKPADHVGALRRSAGRGGPHCIVEVVDEADNPVPPGVVGEITVAGGQVMQGYWNQPEVTARTLRNGRMHTGDAGYLDTDGYLFVVDRIKDMIITGGENVYSPEVENVLSSHPAIAQCAVVGLPDEDWGERVHAVIVINDGHPAPALAELRDFVSAHVARYKAPRSLEVTEALPVSAAGKILKRELREAAATAGL